MALNALAPQGDINTYITKANEQIAKFGGQKLHPDTFYSLQLLDTIRLDSAEYVYFRYADTVPIANKSSKLMVRRWAPLQAHTTPLVEGVPPVSDKGSMEYYEIDTNQYGRYMEFSDKVDFKVVDPILAHYTKEYSIIAIETLDLLARETLFALANKFYAGMVDSFGNLTKASAPQLDDLRKITLSLKKQLVKPRSNGRYHVIAGPDFYFDMVTDPRVEKFMRINNNTYSLYSQTKLVPMFDMEFYETLACPVSGEFMTVSGPNELWNPFGATGGYVNSINNTASPKENSAKFDTTTAAKVKLPKGDIDNLTITRALRVYGPQAGTGASGYAYATLTEDSTIDGKTMAADRANAVFKLVSGYVKDRRTGEDASYIPNQRTWDIAKLDADGIAALTWTDDDGEAVAAANNPAVGTIQEFKVMKVLVLGKDALIRTGMSGRDSAKVYTKAKGSAGVLDPIDQRQSIGFKIDDIGFGSARLEAITEYDCVPSTLNIV